MSQHWQYVPLYELLSKSEERITLNPEERYREITVKLWGKGVMQRRGAVGAEIAAGIRFVARKHQFILSRIDARNGAFGLVPDALDGAIVTNDFPLFNLNTARLLPRYLEWLSKTAGFVDLCKAASEGTTNRIRLKEERFLAATIPLPSVEEQRRIVARIEELAAKIEEARGLRRQSTGDADRVLISMAHRTDLDLSEKIRRGWKEFALNDVLRQVEDAHIVTLETSYPNLGIYSFGRGLFKKPPIQGFATSAQKLYRVRAGQFIYSRLFAFEGAYGWVSDEFDGYFVSGEYPTFGCDPERVRAEFLFAYFKSPAVWTAVSFGSKGLGDRRQRVKADHFLRHRLLLPPMEWQERVYEMLAKIEMLKQWQAETSAELDALLPSILDKAFKGEL